MCVIHEEEIIKIPSYLSRRLKGGIYVEFGPVREWREYLGKNTHLDVVGYFELTFNSFLGRCGLGKLVGVFFQINGHLVEGTRKLGKFAIPLGGEAI